jgi:hypothetical protein
VENYYMYIPDRKQGTSFHVNKASISIPPPICKCYNRSHSLIQFGSPSPQARKRGCQQELRMQEIVTKNSQKIEPWRNMCENNLQSFTVLLKQSGTS